MTRFIASLILVLALVFTTACDSTPTVAATATTPQTCDLSAIKIKEVKFEGDKMNYMGRALRLELYKFGAKNDSNGVEILGNTQLYVGSVAPLRATVEIPTMQFSGVADYEGFPNSPEMTAKSLATNIVKDFCTSVAAAPKPSKK